MHETTIVELVALRPASLVAGQSMIRDPFMSLKDHRLYKWCAKHRSGYWGTAQHNTPQTQ